MSELTVNSFFATEGGLIAAVKPNFAPRQGQAELSTLIEGAITSECHVIAEAATGFGKCVLPGTLFTLRGGLRIPVERLEANTEVLTWTEAGYSYQKARVWQSTEQLSYAIKTLAGRELQVSGEHPCWTNHRWIRADSLTTSMFLGISRNQPHGSKSYNIDMAWIIGLLIGDGGLTVSTSVTIAAPDVLIRAKEHCDKLGWDIHKRKSSNYSYGITIPGEGGRRKRAIPTELRRLGLWGIKSESKRIPTECFTWNKEAVASLLDGYFNADGGAEASIEYYSMSKGLLQDVQSLLLRFGIVSWLRVKKGIYLGKRHLSWRLIVSSSSAPAFVALLTGNTKRVQKARILAARAEARGNDNIDIIPQSILDQFIIDYPTQSSMRNNKCHIHQHVNRKGKTRSKVLKFCDTYGCYPELQQNANLAWDEIVEIIPMGMQQTFSVEVENTHTHVTNDIVTHNSMAYLVPSITQAVNYNKRIVISTETLTLQDQLVYTDLPLLHKACKRAGHTFSYAVAKGKNNYACFGPETEVITWDGNKRIVDLAGTTTRIVDGRGSWVDAEIREMGIQPLYAIELERCGKRKTIYATAEHRWFVRKNGNNANETIFECVTTTLLPGNRLKCMHPKPVTKLMRPSPFGVAHGFTFGDGTCFAPNIKKMVTATVRLFGDKDQALRPYFSLCEIKPETPSDIDKYEVSSERVCDLPNFFKRLPDLDEAPSYLYGWLAGYFAADGTVGTGGNITLNSARKENLEFVQRLCLRLGIAYYPITEESRLGKGTEITSLYGLTLDNKTLSEDFFLIDEHKKRFRQNTRGRLSRHQWKVISVTPTNRVEPVYCAIVPTTESFVLTDYILTGNCSMKVFDDTNTKKSQLLNWAQAQDITKGNTGDISDVPAEVQYDPLEWLKIGCDDQCTKKACPFFGAGANVEKGETECFAYQARRNYAEAQIVVANHTLVLLDAMLGVGTLLGPYDVLIVDEAHSMPEKAQDAWGKSLRPTTVSKVIMNINRMMQRANGNLDATDVGEFSDLEAELFNHFSALVHKGNSMPMTKVPKDTVNNARESAANIVFALRRVGIELSEKFRRLTGESLEEVMNYDVDDESATKMAYAKAMGSPLGGAIMAAKESLSALIGTVSSIFGDNLDPEYVENWLSFVEIGMNKHGKHAVLHLKPIEVAPLMKGLLIDKIPTCVYLSATMKINDTFHFMRKEMSLPYDKTVEFSGQSPFDFSGVTAYVPRDLPACERGQEEPYLDAMAQECIGIIKKMKGRTMVLFTNAKHMREVYNRVVANVPYQVYLQGQMSKNTLLEVFREEISSCLFATRSYFTGVDVPGESLSCVVLTKAPFRVPTEPMFEARCQKIKEAGGSDFSDYSLPLMLFDYKQIFGRLIRTTSDIGMFAFLDSRATTKSYWTSMRSTLPAEIRYIQKLERYNEA